MALIMPEPMKFDSGLMQQHLGLSLVVELGQKVSVEK
jgi:hypothetical protein